MPLPLVTPRAGISVPDAVLVHPFESGTTARPRRRPAVLALLLENPAPFLPEARPKRASRPCRLTASADTDPAHALCLRHPAEPLPVDLEFRTEAAHLAGAVRPVSHLRVGDPRVAGADLRLEAHDIARRVPGRRSPVVRSARKGGYRRRPVARGIPGSARGNTARHQDEQAEPSGRYHHKPPLALPSCSPPRQPPSICCTFRENCQAKKPAKRHGEAPAGVTPQRGAGRSTLSDGRPPRPGNGPNAAPSPGRGPSRAAAAAAAGSPENGCVPALNLLSSFPCDVVHSRKPNGPGKGCDSPHGRASFVCCPRHETPCHQTEGGRSA